MQIRNVLLQKTCHRLRAILASCVLSVVTLNPVWADDVEIYFSSASGGVAPNLLFVLDASASMRRFDCLPTPSNPEGKSQDNPCPDNSLNGNTSRLDRMINAINEVLPTLPDDFNVGVMRFGGYDGGRVIYPFARLGDSGVRQGISDIMDDIDLAFGTASVGALEEAWRYFTGRPVFHGLNRAITHDIADARKSRVSHPDSYTGGTVAGRGATCSDNNLSSVACQHEHITGAPVYKSPIVNECQANYAIMLTDGGPYHGVKDNRAPPEHFQSIATIEGLNGGPCTAHSVSSEGLCGEEMARYMATNDEIITHAIGFNIRHRWIQDVAAAGGGDYIEAASSNDLVNAISSIATQISETGSTFVAPSVTIDQFTRLSHREEVYLALFKPQASSNWVGNLKKYKFSGADATLKDQDGNDVIDPVTGEFQPGSRSFWSAAVDGGDIAIGGAASRLDANTRKMYSYLEVGTTDLTAIGNRINAGNVSPALIGAASNVERDTYLQWLSGVDVKDKDADGAVDDARNHIGDPLHSSPVVVSYGVQAGATLDKDNLNSLVFFGTNEGFLHAIDTGTGVEEYAFMPPELLANVGTLFSDASLSKAEDRIYGLDGDITLRTIDKNNNGLIESANGDKAYLYVGMRRGGNNYYALDVSDKGQPKFMWSIVGGAGDYAELGQSWSKPLTAQVKIGSDVKDVLVFGGGYDQSQDDKTQRAPDSTGRAIYMVDADTGGLLWSGGNPASVPVGSSKHFGYTNMTYSIPANLSIVKDSSSGYLTQMYVGDMGGRLWRFDIDNGSALPDLVNGGVIADFGEDGSTTGARRFFASPDLSLSRVEGELTMNIAIGSGYRAHPLDQTIEDKFFLLRYPYAGYGDNYGVATTTGATVSYLPAELDDLFDATSNVIAEGLPNEVEQARLDLAAAEGWRISMEDSGEKILDHSSTFEGVVRFVSYVPLMSSDPCQPNLGSSFFYAVNLQDGTPFEDINEGVDDSHKKVYRRKLIPTPGIAPPVSTIFVESNGTVTPTDVSGVNKLHEFDNVDLLRKWFWAENPE